MHKVKVVIIGGGFAGVKCALDLCEDERLDITLISDRENFRYYPTLYHTATGGTLRQSSISLKHLFANKAVTLVNATVKSINREEKKAIDTNNETYSFDLVVVALGVVTNYFGIKGLDEYSYNIKTQEDAERFKHHLHKQLLDDRKPDLNYVIIGGGPTGIELAGALPDYLRKIMKNHGISHRAIHVDLVEAMPHLMPRMPKQMGRKIEKRLRNLGVRLYLGKAVQGETADTLLVDGKPITSHTVVWTAGVMNHPFFKENDFSLNEHGKVNVNQYLETESGIYVIGDNANTTYSGMAQTAIYDAEFVAENIKRQLDHKPLKQYKPHRPIYVTPAGPQWAAVLWGKAEFYGRVGWWLRQLADFKAFEELESIPAATAQWLTEFSSQEECQICGLGISA